MKLSVSTRIFLGFALVIIAFVSAYTYTLIQSKALRESFMVTWQGIAPIATELKELSRGVREPQEFLELRRPSDAHYLHQFLPRPFERFRDVESKLRTLVELSDVVASDRRRLVKAADRLKGFRLGSELKEAIGVDNLTQELSEQPTNEDFFKQLIRGTIKAANEGRLTNRSLQARATIKALRRIDVVVNDARKELQKSLRDLPDRARQEARAATTWMVLIAAGALLLSLLILVWSHLILRPIRELHEGARRIAAGHYDETVRVRSADEIGQLAAEFNTMATALRMRDEKLARQRVELLRADRLATIGEELE